MSKIKISQLKCCNCGYIKFQINNDPEAIVGLIEHALKCNRNQEKLELSIWQRIKKIIRHKDD
jgi:hypothetical protein